MSAVPSTEGEKKLQMVTRLEWFDVPRKLLDVLQHCLRHRFQGMALNEIHGLDSRELGGVILV
jgi:hypothetical protein